MEKWSQPIDQLTRGYLDGSQSLRIKRKKGYAIQKPAMQCTRAWMNYKMFKCAIVCVVIQWQLKSLL